MIAFNKDVSEFYFTFKVHKCHKPMRAPPPWPIVSSPVTENIAAFVDHHIKETSKQHQSYLQDTDFLRFLESINPGPTKPYLGDLGR